MEFHVPHIIAQSLDEMQQATEAQTPCLLSSTQCGGPAGPSNKALGLSLRACYLTSSGSYWFYATPLPKSHTDVGYLQRQKAAAATKD